MELKKGTLIRIKFGDDDNYIGYFNGIEEYANKESLICLKSIQYPKAKDSFDNKYDIKPYLTFFINNNNCLSSKCTTCWKEIKIVKEPCICKNKWRIKYASE